MSTRVVHRTTDDYEVDIGRPGEWGNPFVVGRDGTRKQCIERFRAKVLADPELIAKIRRELTGKVLGCWCKPLPCHGDVYVEICDQPRRGLLNTFIRTG